jgi:sulfur carrier protein
VKIRLNGKLRDVADEATVAALVTELALDEGVIAVELNREVVRRGSYDAKRLRQGDEVEIVTLVGGG